MKKYAIAISSLILMASCAVGPDFKSPQLNLPDTFVYDSLTKGDLEDYTGWWRSFGDLTLDGLIRMALDSNKNLSVAVLNVEQARIQARSAKMSILPTLSVNASADLDFTMERKLTQQYNAGLGLSWDLDLFGKIRRMAEGARYDYYATEWGSRAVKLALIAEVANNYFSLQEYRQNLAIARQTYASRSSSAALIDSMFHYGATSLVDLEQARASQASAAAAVEQYERACLQSELTLDLLLSQNPGSVEIGMVSPAMTVPDIPAGLPSTLLERRPDVMQSYFEAASANAAIGVAIANRLPSVSLTGQGGLVSEEVRGISSGKPIGWSATGNLLAPILNWGNNKRAVDLARSRSQEAVLNYQQTALTALSEVEQALVAVNTYKSQIEEQVQLLKSSQTAQQLTQELYKAGAVNYLNLLDADRTLFSAELAYWQTVSQYRSACVTLYKALGGGW